MGHPIVYHLYIEKQMIIYIERRNSMKGYIVSQGYMGYVNGSYRLFPSEMEYVEFMEEE